MVSERTNPSSSPCGIFLFPLRHFAIAMPCFGVVAAGTTGAGCRWAGATAGHRSRVSSSEPLLISPGEPDFFPRRQMQQNQPECVSKLHEFNHFVTMHDGWKPKDLFSSSRRSFRVCHLHSQRQDPKTVHEPSSNFPPESSQQHPQPVKIQAGALWRVRRTEAFFPRQLGRFALITMEKSS